MNFTDKLSRLTENRSKAEVARKAGLSSPAISDYLQKGYIPRADNALALARALDVPLDWLVDDNQDWPPPPVEKPTPALLPDEELMREVSRRFRLAAINLHEWLEHVESVHWMLIAQTLFELPLDAELPLELKDHLKYAIPAEAILEWTIHRFDPSWWTMMHHQELPGAQLPDVELITPALEGRVTRLFNREHILPQISMYLKMRREPKAREKGIAEAVRQGGLNEVRKWLATAVKPDRVDKSQSKGDTPKK